MSKNRDFFHYSHQILSQSKYLLGYIIYISRKKLQDRILKMRLFSNRIFRIPCAYLRCESLTLLLRSSEVVCNTHGEYIDKNSYCISIST